MSLRIVSRSEWGARATRSPTRMAGPATSVTAHHSLSPALPSNAGEAAERAAVQSIQRYHIDVNGWADIGYGFVIAQSGRAYEGRGWGIVGAHAGTDEGNRTSIGVCFLIDGRTEAPSPAALGAFYGLRHIGESEGHLRVGHLLKLHRDWKQTDCPGDIAAAVLRERNGNHTPVAPPRLLRRGVQGDDVLALQHRLVQLGHMSGAQVNTGPGIFGPQTEAAVKLFQWRNGLAADGVVGPRTRAALGL